MIAMAPLTLAAIDLGATSGRVILGHLDDDGARLTLEQVARFPNGPIDLPDGLHWDIVHLYASAVEGLRTAVAAGHEIASVAVDSWAVDYGLLTDGRLAGLPYNYRDSRCQRGVEAVHARVPFAELYGRNGLQFLPFNTAYQLAAEVPAGYGADRLLMIPDLIAYWLTGTAVTERTNASSTGLLDPRSREWDTALMERLDIPASMFAPLVDAGDRIGPLRDPVVDLVGARFPVLASPTHDTAAAVAAVPMDPEHAAYISCGTWGLVGVELPAPVLTDQARTANFTNEGGVDGTTRFLHNVMGLWVLTQTLATWRAQGRDYEINAIVDAAAAQPTPQALVDVDDERFLPPGDMPTRIVDWLTERGLPVPTSDAAMVRLIEESLADAFARAVREAARLSGRDIRRIHIVGGGARDTLLCQLTADLSGLPVLAGPSEATAIGNLLTQARAHGAIEGLAKLREVVARSFVPRTYQPRSPAPQ